MLTPEQKRLLPQLRRELSRREVSAADPVEHERRVLGDRRPRRLVTGERSEGSRRRLRCRAERPSLALGMTVRRHGTLAAQRPPPVPIRPLGAVDRHERDHVHAGAAPPRALRRPRARQRSRQAAVICSTRRSRTRKSSSIRRAASTCTGTTRARSFRSPATRRCSSTASRRRFSSSTPRATWRA